MNHGFLNGDSFNMQDDIYNTFFCLFVFILKLTKSEYNVVNTCIFLMFC